MLRKVCDRLWVGSSPTLKMLDDSGADAVVCTIKKGTSEEVVNRVQYYSCYPIPDGKRFDEELFRRAVSDAEFFMREGRTVLVHCRAGRNRSATVCAIILIRQGWDPLEAIKFIRFIRPRAIANPVFEARLLQGKFA